MKRSKSYLLTAAVALVLTACGETQKPNADAASSAASAASGTTTTYPYTFDNCGHKVTINKAPERIFLMGPTALTSLDAVGATDKIVSLAGQYPKEYYSEALNEKIKSIPRLTSKIGTSGGVSLSLESIIDLKPDIVFGYENDAITRDALAKAGIQLYVNPTSCKGMKPVASFDAIYKEIINLGEIFNKQTVAQKAAEELKNRVAETISKKPEKSGLKAATIYVESDGKQLWTFSKRSMSHLQLEALGYENIYAENDERCYEVSLESIIDKKPDMLVLLYDGEELKPEVVLNMVKKMPGAESIPAIANNMAFPQLYNFSETATPLIVNGLTMLQEKVAQ